MSCGGKDDEHQQIVAELAGYLSTHNQAADTLEGIRDWWLPRDRVPLPSQDVLLAAIETLIQDGSLVRFESSNGLVLYISRSGRKLH